MGLFQFRKEERLRRKKHIEELFQKGTSFNLYPFRILFLVHPDPAWAHHQVLISVSVKKFKRAVDRNLIKRRIREAYRLQKNKISPNSKLLIGFQYTAREILPFQEIKNKVLMAIARIEKMEKTQVRKA